MKIGELAQKTGLTKETIRFYEKIKLLPLPTRTQNGYRQYNQDTVDLLLLLKHGKELGLSLNELKELGQLLRTKNLTRKEMSLVLKKKEKEIDEKILKLEKFKEEIKLALSGMCEYQEFLVN